jgi:hypothetical protein
MAENDDSKDPVRYHYQLIARLYEAAEQNEQGIKEAIGELRQIGDTFQKQVNTLPDKVASHVNRELDTSFANAKRQLDAASDAAGNRIVQKFMEANAKADKAAAAYERAAKFSIGRVVAIGLFAVFCGIAAMVVTASFIVPNAETVHALRMEEARLRADIEEWRRMEGANVLSYCKDGSATRRCVRTDERAENRFVGDRGQTYRIIYGY